MHEKLVVEARDRQPRLIRQEGEDLVAAAVVMVAMTVAVVIEGDGDDGGDGGKESAGESSICEQTKRSEAR